MSIYAPPNETPGSVTQCLNNLRRGESDAQQLLWDRFLDRLLGLARNRLRGLQDPMTEPDDLASIVFYDFLLGIKKNSFNKVDDRHDLWQVLVMLTNRRAIDRRRKARAKKRDFVSNHVIRSNSKQPLDTIDTIISRDPRPEEAVILADEIRLRLDSLCDERLVAIAKGKLAGKSHEEIAANLDCSTRSVERKLVIIRRKWGDAL